MEAAERRRIEQRSALLEQIASNQIQALSGSSVQSDRVRAIELEIVRAKQEQLEVTEQIRRAVPDPAEAAAALSAVQETTAAHVKALEEELGEASKSAFVVHMEAALDTVGESFSNIVDQMIATGRVDFENLGRALGGALVKGLVEEFLLSPLLKALKAEIASFSFSGSGDAISGGLKALAGVFGIPTFASGGIFTRPTLGVIAESGAEAVIPLNRAGALGGGGDVVQVFNMSDPRGVGVMPKRSPNDRLVRVVVGREVQDDIAHNGPISRMLNARFGIVPRGS
jgi:hypothetical protein